jgi:hypothetical protein
MVCDCCLYRQCHHLPYSRCDWKIEGEVGTLLHQQVEERVRKLEMNCEEEGVWCLADASSALGLTDDKMFVLDGVLLWRSVLNRLRGHENASPSRNPSLPMVLPLSIVESNEK